MSLLLTFNRFHTFPCCIHCWIWTSKCQLGFHGSPLAFLLLHLLSCLLLYHFPLLHIDYVKITFCNYHKKICSRNSVSNSLKIAFLKNTCVSVSPYISFFMFCIECLSVCMDCWNFCNLRKAVKTSDPFVPNAPFLYPLKTENRGCIWKEWVNKLIYCPNLNGFKWKLPFCSLKVSVDIFYIIYV